MLGEASWHWFSVRQVPLPFRAFLVSQMEELAEMIYLQGFLQLSHSVSQTLVIRGHQALAFPKMSHSWSRDYSGANQEEGVQSLWYHHKVHSQELGSNMTGLRLGQMSEAAFWLHKLFKLVLLKGTLRLGSRNLLEFLQKKQLSLSGLRISQSLFFLLV